MRRTLKYGAVRSTVQAGFSEPSCWDILGHVSRDALWAKVDRALVNHEDR